MTKKNTFLKKCLTETPVCMHTVSPMFINLLKKEKVKLAPKAFVKRPESVLKGMMEIM